MVNTSSSLAALVGEALHKRNLTMCTAESCTGGLIASLLTDIPGSSAYMLGGVVSYSNEAKRSLLKVRQGTLMAYGAVSEPTAAEMAQGAQQIFGADYAISVTGIAGPGGGTADKPVGLTYIGIAKPDGSVSVQRHVWDGDRIQNKHASASAAFQLILADLTD